jgi:uncharacterized protein
MKLIERNLTRSVKESLKDNPVVAITGPRQCGKSTLVKNLLNIKDLLYLDLERTSDLRKLDEPEWFLESQKKRTICLDEVQRKPEIFPLIRSLVDDWGKKGCFIILGSASGEMLKQSSESLTGRISYKRLTPFLWSEISKYHSLESYLLRGGFPGSLLARNDSVSFEWKENFISTFIERDLLQWTGSSSVSINRLWQMLAHNNGQTINFSALGNSLGLSNTTIRNYTDILRSAYMADILPPLISNTGKRLIKAPKIYISDSGILTGLLGLKNFEELSGHPVFGSLWEGMVLSNLRGYFPNLNLTFYRTSHGAEIDFLLSTAKGLIAVECKASKSPSLSRGSYSAIDDLKPVKTFIVAPVEECYEAGKDLEVVSVGDLVKKIRRITGDR